MEGTDESTRRSTEVLIINRVGGPNPIILIDPKSADTKIQTSM